MAATKSKALVKWDEKLAAKAAAAAATEVLGSGSNISIKGGQLTVDGVKVPGNAANFIVVASNFNNQFREGAYDPENYEAPACFAFGDTEAELVPHEKSAKAQADSCSVCPQNEWGSANVGKGKACRQARDLILVSADAEDIETAKLYRLSVPPTSLKAWKGYVHQLNNTLQRPTMSVITEVKAVVIGTYPGIEFKMVDKIDDGEVLEAIEGREAEAVKILTKPYEQVVKEIAPAKKGSKLKARKF